MNTLKENQLKKDNFLKVKSLKSQIFRHSL